MMRNTLFGVAMLGTALAGTNSASAATTFYDQVKSGTPHEYLKDSNGNPLIDDKEYYIQPYDNPEGKLDIFIQQNGDIPWVTATGHKMKVQLLPNGRIELDSSSVSYNHYAGRYGGYDDEGPLWGRLYANDKLRLLNPYRLYLQPEGSAEWRILDHNEGNYYRINSPTDFKDLEYAGMNNYIKLAGNNGSTSLQWRFVPAE